MQGVRKEVAQYLSKCLDCQQVNVEHQHPVGLLNPLHILEWNREIISLYFIIRLPLTKVHHESIMVVVDTLSKETHFILVKSTFGTRQIVNIFVKEIFRLHGVPKMIVLDKDTKFTSKLS